MVEVILQSGTSLIVLRVYGKASIAENYVLYSNLQLGFLLADMNIMIAT